MQKNSLIFLAVLILFVLSACNHKGSPKPQGETPVLNETSEPTSSAVEATDEIDEVEGTDSAQEATQILQDYTPELFAQFKGQQKFALYFAADWCTSCRATKQAIADNPENFAGVILLEVDYDKSKELKDEYGIVRQHAFVFFDASGEIVSTKYFPRDEEVADFF